jgi:NAD(P)-dependent dehydrogenase (short-subunit alcohol dehydrogenase family)
MQSHVAISIAGALGRAYALLLASRGCAVVVNDLGVPLLGSGISRGPAEAVVQEIIAAGGRAIANYDSVLEGAKIVAATIAAYGRVDIVINNAGGERGGERASRHRIGCEFRCKRILARQ